MTPKFKIGDIITWKYNSKYQAEIIEIIGNSEKLVKGPWNSGSKELLIQKNCYVFKDLEINKLIWAPVLYIENHYKLLQQVKNEPLRWKNYEEILI